MITPITRRDVIAHQSVVPWPSQVQVEQDLLLCRAMVALFDDAFLQGQIAMRGGTLLHKVHLAPASRYSDDIDLRMEGSVAGRAAFVALLDAHLGDRGFCSDMNPLLRVGITYDPQQAGDYVKTKLLSLLPAR